MKRKIHAASTFAFAVVTSTFSASADPVWKPADFEGAYVEIIDSATNGCWTNIGEVRKYAEDQLELTGFKYIGTPEFDEGIPHPLLRENILEYRLHVNASRTENGVCIGYLNSSFWGAVSPGYNQEIRILGQLGPAYVWSVWNKDSLNKYMFDQVKGTMKAWVKFGARELDVE